MLIFQYLKENIDALKIRLSEDALQEICGFAERADKNVIGDHLPESSMSFVFADTPEL